MYWSVLLFAGFGNNLFQISFLYQYAKKYGLKNFVYCHWNNTLSSLKFLDIHLRKSDRRTIEDIFDSIPFEPEEKLIDRTVYLTHAYHDKFGVHSPERFLQNIHEGKTEYIVFSDYFFNYRYHIEFRNEFIEWLKFKPSVLAECPIIDYSKTIAVHARLGSIKDRGLVDYISSEKYKKAILWLRQKFPELTTVLICSETIAVFDRYIPFSWFEKNGLKWIFLDADPEVCVAAMSKCRHYVCGNSTLSYMMSFLNPKFPDESIVFCEKFSYIPSLCNPEWNYVEGKGGYFHYSDLKFDISVPEVKSTLVTAFFDLSEQLDLIGSTVRTVEFYIEKGLELLTRVDENGDCFPMIIFCQERHKDKIKIIRERIDPKLEKTHFEVLEFSDIPIYEYYETVVNLRKIASSHIFRDPRNAVSSCILYCSKPWFMRRAAEINPFKSEIFFWIDFGIFHVKQDFSDFNRIIKSYNGKKMRLMYIVRHRREEYNSIEFYNRPRCCIAAGFFAGSREIIPLFYDLFMKTFRHHLNDLHYVHSEEQIFGNMSFLCPNLFDFTYGDYQFLFSNFLKMKNGVESTINLVMIPAQNDNDLKLAIDVATKIKESEVKLSNEHKMLVDRLFKHPEIV